MSNVERFLNTFPLKGLNAVVDHVSADRFEKGLTDSVFFRANGYFRTEIKIDRNVFNEFLAERLNPNQIKVTGYACRTPNQIREILEH